LVGIIAASLGAISAIFVMPYYPVWSLFYVIIAVMVVYGLVAGYGEKTEKPARGDRPESRPGRRQELTDRLAAWCRAWSW
jgi:hypothetical protein